MKRYSRYKQYFHKFDDLKDNFSSQFNGCYVSSYRYVKEGIFFWLGESCIGESFKQIIKNGDFRQYEFNGINNRLRYCSYEEDYISAHKICTYSWPSILNDYFDGYTNDQFDKEIQRILKSDDWFIIPHTGHYLDLTLWYKIKAEIEEHEDLAKKRLKHIRRIRFFKKLKGKHFILYLILYSILGIMVAKTINMFL